MTSVITWHTYDVTPETLPEREKRVLVRQINREEADFATLDYFLVWNFNNRSCSDAQISDVWARLPEPPKEIG